VIVLEQEKTERKRRKPGGWRIESSCLCQDGFSGTLTILVLTSFSIALTSSAALGISAELCREAISTEDYRTAGQEERDVSRRNRGGSAQDRQFIKLWFGEKRSKLPISQPNMPNISPPSQKGIQNIRKRGLLL